MDHQILSKYLVEYKSQPRAFKETLALPQFIQLKEERRPCSRKEIKGNRFLLSTFDGSSIARTWVRKMEVFFLLHLVVEEEAIEILVLHMEGEAYFWWISHLSYARVSTLAEFSQRMVRRFEKRREEPSPLVDEACTSAIETMEKKPSSSTVWEANTYEGETLAALQELPHFTKV